LVTHKFKIEDRHRKAATLLAQSMTESEIAQELKVDQSTISRDIKVLKELSNNYVLLLLFDSLSHNTDMPITLSLKVFLTLPLDNHIL
jgi:Trp operon repressor